MEIYNVNQKRYQKFQIDYPKRPIRGEKLEKTTKIICNMKKINLGNILKDKDIMQYSISYYPEIKEDNNSLKRSILRQLKTDFNGIFDHSLISGDTIFVYSKKTKEKYILSTKIDDTEYEIKLNRTSNSIKSEDIISLSNDNQKIKHFVNCIFRNIIQANNHLVKIGDNYFDTHNVQRTLKNKVRIWNGFSAKVCITYKGLYILMNSQIKVLNGLTALEKMNQIAKKFQGDIQNTECQKEIEKFFKGKNVVTQIGDYYRAYKVDDISFDKTINNTSFIMETNEGEKTVTLKEYYKLKYKLNLKNDEQPLLIEEGSKKGSGNEKYLIPELSFLVSNDELDINERKMLFLKSGETPESQFSKLNNTTFYLTNTEKKIITRNGKPIELQSPDEIRNDWGINIENEFVEISSAILPIPEIQFNSDGYKIPELICSKFQIKNILSPINFDENNCLVLTFDNLINVARNDCEQMNKAAQKFGLQFNLPKLKNLPICKKTEIVNELQKLDLNNGKIMVIVIVDEKTKDLYPEIKNYIYSQGGIACQFMLHDENIKNRSKFNMSYYSKVLSQMVVKAKGELFSIKFCDKISLKPTMIIGIDVLREKKGEIKYMVSSSYNKRLSKYYTNSKNCINIKEKGIILSNLIKNSIDEFKKYNNNLPKNIIIYRRGGSDMDIEKVYKDELSDVKNLLNGDEENGAYEKEYKPNLTFFLVSKKPDLKFVKKSEKYENVIPGTVIDEDIVNPGIFEFYLQSVNYTKGYATPIYYLCIFNNNEDITMTEFEKITYYMTYYHWNVCGTSSIPVPLRYAEDCNRFTNKYLKEDVQEDLKSTPYFI